MLLSTNYLNRYLSLDRICDYGHITHWLTHCPMVKIIKVVYTKPHIPAIIVDYKDLITVVITVKTIRVLKVIW
ncbi:hypothetical protein Hanom_Chr13g01195101 [Helianthus anomalus]